MREVVTDVSGRVVPDCPITRESRLITQSCEFPAGSLAIVLNMQLYRGTGSSSHSHDFPEHLVGSAPYLIRDWVVRPSYLSEADSVSCFYMIECEVYCFDVELCRPLEAKRLDLVLPGNGMWAEYDSHFDSVCSPHFLSHPKCVRVGSPVAV